MCLRVFCLHTKEKGINYFITKCSVFFNGNRIRPIIMYIFRWFRFLGRCSHVICRLLTNAYGWCNNVMVIRLLWPTYWPLRSSISSIYQKVLWFLNWYQCYCWSRYFWWKSKSKSIQSRTWIIRSLPCIFTNNRYWRKQRMG